MKFRIHAASVTRSPGRIAVGAFVALGVSLALGFGGASKAHAVQLVTDETIKTQKDLTTTGNLKNGASVIIREVAGSDIVAVHVTFATGLRDLKPGKKVLNEWLWPSLTMAGKTIPKEKVFETVEKYGLELGCNGGIETSACGLGTVNDYWTEGLTLFSTLLKSPAFNEEDLKLTKDRLTAQLKNVPTDPNNYVNEIINSIFYPVGHPYRLNHDEALAELEHLGKKDLEDLHSTVMNAKLMTIVVATSMPAAKVMQDLEAAFGQIGTQAFTPVVAVAPVFDAKKAYTFHDRDLPTAFIKIKLNAPPANSKDSVSSRLLYEILSEELGDEIRTKRSLSYAVHSFVIQYSLGIGVISASTSKPKETLEAIHQVLQTIKTKDFSTEEIEHYKRGFATSYYLTLETHGSLAGALADANVFYGTPNALYDMPRKLDAVTSADIKRLANELLSDLRIGVIYGRKEFKDAWAEDLIKKNIRTAAKPTSKKS